MHRLQAVKITVHHSAEREKRSSPNLLARSNLARIQHTYRLDWRRCRALVTPAAHQVMDFPLGLTIKYMAGRVGGRNRFLWGCKISMNVTEQHKTLNLGQERKQHLLLLPTILSRVFSIRQRKRRFQTRADQTGCNASKDCWHFCSNWKKLCMFHFCKKRILREFLSSVINKK